MLFNSHIFIFVFLPVALLAFYGLAKLRLTIAALSWLVIASLLYYAYWNVSYLALLLSSITFNYHVGRLIERYRSTRQGAKALLVIGVGANLALLAYYKYAAFLLTTAMGLEGTTWIVTNLALPLGISFFTLTQIAYVVDLYRGTTQGHQFLTYLLFVCFFPHLMAGPILYHNDIVPQFQKLRTFVFSHRHMATGLLLFSVGLFKKVVIADHLTRWVTPVFDSPGDANFVDAWVGALAYSFQLYFDFSGYSDMAIGLGLMFNIRFLLNFNSPYKATSIVDFWRRWHMSLALFLKNYVYIPLGGNRRGERRRMGNILVTMLIGGLWHGAGWTYVVWGGLHGVLLIINHAWRNTKIALPTGLCWALTFLAVVMGWVIFRARTLSDAIALMETMIGVNGIQLAPKFQHWLPGLSQLGVGFTESRLLAHGEDYLGQLFLLLLPVLLGPNSQELAQRLRPTWAWALFVASVGSYGVLSLNRASEFLYYQF